jgi:predicted transcriptional regulator
VIVLSDSPSENIGKWEICPTGARLAGASVTKTSTLLGVSRAIVSKVMSACTNHVTTTSAKRDSGRKSELIERNYLKL